MFRSISPQIRSLKKFFRCSRTKILRHTDGLDAIAFLRGVQITDNVRHLEGEGREERGWSQPGKWESSKSRWKGSWPWKKPLIANLNVPHPNTQTVVRQ